MELEIWKDIQGYESLYQISNLGRVKSLKRKCGQGNNNSRMVNERIRRDRVNSRGYCYVSLHKNGKRKTFTIHRMVGLAFIINPKHYPEINHIDGIKTNNNVNNLEWVTTSMNIKHAYSIGMKETMRGESSNLSKLKLSQVIKIRQLYSKGNYNKIYLSKLFNCSLGNIRLILNNKTWH